MRYAIYEDNMERLGKKMTRIQNKCKKYGCDFHYEEVGEEFRTLKDEDGNEYIGRFVLIEAEGVAIVNGWQFIASVEHTDKGNIIKAACDIEVPEKYYTSKPVCEHCHCERHRRDTYIVMDQETGEFKQVGKSCLKDFTHGMSAEAVAEYTAAFDELIEGEAPYEGSSIQHYYKTEEYLRYVAETIRHFGYVKTDSYGASEISTKDRSLNYYRVDNGAIHGKMCEEFRRDMERVGFDAESSEATATVKAALEWLDQQPEDSNYMHNMKVACALEYQSYKNLGILASLFPTYNRELEYQAKIKREAEAAQKSQYVGEIGQRIEFEPVSVVCVTSWETQWGLTKIYKIEDQAGNIYTWKTSNWIPEHVKSIKGTIKAHTEYRGAKQTEITRCKVTEKPRGEQKHEEYTGAAEKAVEDFLKICEE